MTPRLHPDDLAELARLVAEQVRTPPHPEWLTVDQYADRFQVSRSTVYANADELGAVRIGGALRLPATPPQARDVCADAVVPEAPKAARPARRRARATSDLLPIGGDES
jgi:hypothetical protein